MPDELGLVTEAEARGYLGVENDDDPKTEQLTPIILGLSKRIQQRRGVTYINPGASDAETTQLVSFTGVDDEVVTIPPTREITLVEASGDPKTDDAWEELDEDDWIGEPLDDAVVTRLRFLRELPMRTSGWGGLALTTRGSSGIASINTRWPREERAAIKTTTWLRITGKPGYGGDQASVPAHIKLALLMWMENIWKRDQAFFSDNVSRAVITMKMPGDVEELLAGEDEATSTVSAV